MTREMETPAVDLTQCFLYPVDVQCLFDRDTHRLEMNPR